MKTILITCGLGYLVYKDETNQYNTLTPWLLDGIFQSFPYNFSIYFIVGTLYSILFIIALPYGFNKPSINLHVLPKAAKQFLPSP